MSNWVRNTVEVSGPKADRDAFVVAVFASEVDSGNDSFGNTNNYLGNPEGV